MDRAVGSIKFYIFLDLLILLLFPLSISQLYYKAALPFSIQETNEQFVVTALRSENPGLSSGDLIISVQGFTFSSLEEIEVLLDGYKKHDTVQVKYIHNGEIKSAKIQLVPFYSSFYLFLVPIIALIFILIGVIVLIKSPEKKPAYRFHHVNLFTAMIIIFTWGSYNVPSIEFGFITRTLFHVAYLFTPVFFLHFTLVFPRSREENFKKLLYILYSVSAVTALLITLVFYYQAVKSNTGLINDYILIFDLVRFYSIICILLGLSVFVYQFKTSRIEIERKKLKWIIYGFFAGPIAFIFLWVLPQALTSRGLVPEEIILIWICVLIFHFISNFRLPSLHFLILKISL